MPDSITITCPQHGCVLSADTADPGRLFCPEGACGSEVRIRIPDGPLFPVSPLTPLGEGAAGHHELVLTYQAAGFSRTEAMQILCCVISAGIMKDRGNG